MKVYATGHRLPRKLPSGPTLTARRMVTEVLKLTADWRYDAVTIGVPTPVRNGRPAEEPQNIGRGWVRFDYRAAFGKPVVVTGSQIPIARARSDGRQNLVGALQVAGNASFAETFSANVAVGEVIAATATNLATPVWTTNTTGVFGAGGAFSMTNNPCSRDWQLQGLDDLMQGWVLHLSGFSKQFYVAG